MLLQAGERMKGMKVKLKVEGMYKLQSDLKKLGKIPQTHVTAASRKGMNIALKSAKAKAPLDTGNLQKGIVMVGEKSKSKGKKLYRIVFDRSMNDVFQRKNADGKVVAYYPVSQEYGYFTSNGRYIPGFRFVHASLENNRQTIAITIISTLKMKIDQQIRKARLR